jgi:hypothetical protein
VILFPLSALAQTPPAPAGATAGVSTSVNESFQLKYWNVQPGIGDRPDLPLGYIEQINRVIPSLTSGQWTVSVQVDEVALFMNRYYLDDEIVIENDLVVDGVPNLFPQRFDAYLNPEKVRVQVDGKAGTLVLGDAYAAFGRGLALNMNRNVDIDIDTSVQGAKTVLRPGAWDVTLVVGQANRQQVSQETPNREIEGDRRHLVAGARAERFGLGPANLGAHAVIYDFVEDPGFAASIEQLGGPDAVIGGATAELVGVGGMDFYVEGDLFGFGPDSASPLGEDAPDLGYGTYVSASAYPGAFVVLLEGKRYFQAERVNYDIAGEQYEVAIAPTLEYERVVNEDTSATLNSNDIWGARLELNWAAIPGKLSPYAAFAVLRDLDLGSGHFNVVPETVFHPMVGAEWIDHEVALLVNGGYRVDDRDGDADGVDQLTHGDASVNFPLPGDFAGYVSGAGARFAAGENLTVTEPFVEVETAYSLTWAGKLTGTFTLDHTTNPLVLNDGTGNVSEEVFAAGELQFKPNQELTLKAFYGAQKGGIRCAGGQCRTLPPFDGAKVSVSGTF